MAIAVSWSAVDQRREQDHRGAQVVLDGIRKEDRAQEQTGERKPVSQPIGTAANLRLRHDVDEAADDGDHRDRAEDERGDENRVQSDAPCKLPAVFAAPAWRLWRRVPRHQRSIQLGSWDGANRRWPPGVTAAGRTLPWRTARFSVGWLMPSSRAAAFELTSSVHVSTSASSSRNRRCPPGVTTAGLSNPLATARRTVARLTPRRVAKSFELIKVCKSCAGATHF